MLAHELQGLVYSKPAEDLSVLLIDDVLLGLGEVPASATKKYPDPVSPLISCPARQLVHVREAAVVRKL